MRTTTSFVLLGMSFSCLARPIDLFVADKDGHAIPEAYVQGSKLSDFTPSLFTWTGQDGHAILDDGDWNSVLVTISKPGFYQAVGYLGRIIEDATGCHTTVRLQAPAAPVRMVSEWRFNDIRITSEEKPFDLIRGRWHVADNPKSIADVFLRSECEVLSNGAVEKRLYFRFPDHSDGMYLYDYGAISGLSNEAGPNVVIGIDESAFTNSFVLIERHASNRATSPCIPPTNISSKELGQHYAAVFKLRSSLDSGPIYALMADICSIQTPWSTTSNVARFPKWLDFNPNPGVPSVEYSFAEQYLDAAIKCYKAPSSASSQPLRPLIPENPVLPPSEIVTNSIGMKFVPINDGEFFISVYEVRNQDYFHYDIGHRFEEAGLPSEMRRKERPVVLVTADGALRFSCWLTEKEHQTGVLPLDEQYRLPTLDEWLVACFPGTNSVPITFSEAGSRQLGNLQNPTPSSGILPPGPDSGLFSDDGFPFTSDVGSFSPTDNKFD